MSSRTFWTAGNCTILLSLWGFPVIPQTWVLSAACSASCETQAPVLCLYLQAARALQKQTQLLPREKTTWTGGSDPLSFKRYIIHKLKKKMETKGCSPLHSGIPGIQFALWSNINNLCFFLSFMCTKSFKKKICVFFLIVKLYRKNSEIRNNSYLLRGWFV